VWLGLLPVAGVSAAGEVDQEGSRLRVRLRAKQSQVVRVYTTAAALFVSGLGPAGEILCDHPACETLTPPQMRVPLSALRGDEVVLELAPGAEIVLRLPPHPHQPFEVTLAYTPQTGDLLVTPHSDVVLAQVKLDGTLTLELDSRRGQRVSVADLSAAALRVAGGHPQDSLSLSGSLRVAETIRLTGLGVAANQATIEAPHGFVSYGPVLSLRDTTLTVGDGSATLQAEDRLTLSQSQLQVADHKNLKIFLRFDSLRS
jgi:hypothetical protein